MPIVLAGGRVVTQDRVLAPGWIRVADGLIEAIGEGHGGHGGHLGGQAVDLHGQWVLPGFIDLHVHGGGGASFTEGSADDARRAAEFHRGHGSTDLLASLVTAPLAELEARAAMLADLAADGIIAGIHLEGPFLSAARCGAQDPRHMLAPDPAAFERLHAAAAGYLRVITIAPELAGATELIKEAVRAGVTVAVGHTDATAKVTSAAVDAGATHATHLFNGMRPLHHREPGPAGALLDRDEVTCEVIADGVHLHDTTLRLAARAARPIGTTPRRLVLITDAMAAAGMPDGHYRLGSKQVTVAGGVARLTAGPGPGPRSGPRDAGPRPRDASPGPGPRDASPGPGPRDASPGPGPRDASPGPGPRDASPGQGVGPSQPPGAIAGSTATMAGVVRHAIAAGLPVTEVAQAASTTPARVLGIAERTGALRPGLHADLVLADDDFRLRAVMRRGRWLAGCGPD